MADISTSTRDALDYADHHGPHQALLLLQDTIDHPDTSRSPLERLMLLHEAFRLSIVTQQPHVTERYLPDILTLLDPKTLPSPPLHGYVCCTLATALEMLNRQDEAEALYHRALNLDHGPPATSLIPTNTLTPRWIALANLARLLLKRPQPATAATYLSTTISEIRAYYRRPIPELIPLFCDLAQANRRLGALDKAIRSYTQAFDVSIAIHGPLHLVTAEISEHIGQAYLQHHLPDHARLFFERALHIYRHGHHTPFLIRGLSNLLAVAHAQQRYDHVTAYIQEATALLDQTSVEPSLRITVLWNSAVICAHLKRFSHALRYSAQLEHLITVEYADHPERRTTYLTQLRVLIAHCRQGHVLSSPPASDFFAR
jgi:tetratricopeptide (TPR) repeat protein